MKTKTTFYLFLLGAALPGGCSTLALYTAVPEWDLLFEPTYIIPMVAGFASALFFFIKAIQVRKGDREFAEKNSPIAKIALIVALAVAAFFVWVFLKLIALSNPPV